MNLSRRTKWVFGVALLTQAVLGCGSSPNDQGESFSFLGYGFPKVDDNGNIECQIDALTNDTHVVLGTQPESALDTIGCLILQNNMTTVSVRAERAEISYYIPGAEEQPPDTSAPAFIMLSPQSDTSGSGTDTQDNGPAFAQRASVLINVVPPEIQRWLSMNRNKLPDRPISMDIRIHVVGVTTAGDQLVTNDGYLQAQVLEDFFIGTGAGADATPTP